VSIGKLRLYRRKCAVWQVVAELGNADIQLILTKKTTAQPLHVRYFLYLCSRMAALCYEA